MTESPSTPTVALLGTGIMGSGMARNIAAAGLPLRVWNRTAERAAPLADVGRVADTVAEAVDGADVVLTMLFDVDSVADAMAQAKGHLGPDSVWLQQTTVGVRGAARLAELADDLGLPMVDAPVMGTRKPAEEGNLVILASGPEELRDRVQPVLDAVGSRTMWVGTGQEGSRLKLVANAFVVTMIEGLAESLALARDLGLDPADFLAVIEGGAMDSPYVQAKGAAMLSGELEPSFTLEGAYKDVGLILEAAQDTHTELGLIPGVQAHFARAVEAGHADLDMAATYLEH